MAFLLLHNYTDFIDIVKYFRLNEKITEINLIEEKYKANYLIFNIY